MKKKRIRRLTAALLTGIIALSGMTNAAYAWDAPAQSEWQTLGRQNIKARIAVGSDVHIPYYDSEKKLQNAFDSFYRIDPDLDAAAFVGDSVNDADVSKYDKFMAIINKNTGTADKKAQAILCQGNHETYGIGAAAAPTRFKEKTGQDANKAVKLKNGITIITIGPRNAENDYTADYDFLKTSLAKAAADDPTAPIFVLAHHGVPNTAYVTDEWNGNYGVGTSKDLKALMKQYPQVIHISGHSHSTMEDARSIDQSAGFTAIQDGTLGAYFENESGKTDPTTGSNATIPPDSAIASQALMIDVNEQNVVTIRRMNLTTGKYIYEPWVINTPEIVKNHGGSSFPYGKVRISEKPTFVNGSTVTADSATRSSIHVHFPAATPADTSNNNMIQNYKITLTPKDGSESVVRNVFSDFYEPTQKKSWDVKVTGLQAKKEYIPSVQAVTAFGAVSEPITGVKVKTKATAKVDSPEPVLDINYSSGSVKDEQNHTLEQYSKTVAQGTGIDRKVLAFHGEGGCRYALTQNDYDRFASAYTAETYFKIADVNADQCIFSNQQQAGMGFEVENGKLEVWTNTVSGRVTPSAPIDANKWYHAVTTYDGKTAKLYLNGELKDEKTSAGGLAVPDKDAWYYYVGADVESSGGHGYEAQDAEINLARLYTGVMTDTQVKAAYQAAVKDGSLSTAPSAVLKVDYSKGITADAQGHDSFLSGKADVIYAKSLQKNVLGLSGKGAYGYALDSLDYSRIQNKLTLETDFCTPDVQTDQCIISNTQYAGTGFEVNQGKLQFWIHLNGEYAITNVPIEANKWYHAIAVYDGSKVKIYLNGTLAKEEAHQGQMTVPADGAKYFFVGADTNGNGEPEYLMQSGQISMAALYAGAMTNEQVQTEYKAVQNRPTEKDPSAGSGSGSTGSDTSSNKPSPDSTPDKPQNNQNGEAAVSNLSGVQTLCAGGTLTFTVASDAAPQICQGNGLVASVNAPSKDWDAQTRTSTWSVYGICSSKRTTNTTGIYAIVNGVKTQLFTVDVNGQRPFTCDTSKDISMKTGSHYIAKVTVSSGTKLTYNAGNGKIATTFVKGGMKPQSTANGQDCYYLGVQAVSTGSAGLYITVSGIQYCIYHANIK